MLDSLDSTSFQKALERLIDYERSFTVDSVRVAVPIISNRLHRLSNEYVAPLSIPSRAMAILVISRMLENAAAQGNPENWAGEILAAVSSLSARRTLIDTFGHRDVVGKRLVNPETARQFEKKLLADIKMASVDNLANEPDLASISLLPLRWLESEERSDMTSRLAEHICDDRFSVALLKTAIQNSFRNGEKVRVLPWEEMSEVFGKKLPEAVHRLACSDSTIEIAEGDLEAIELAQRYASGNGPSLWGSFV